MGWLFKRKDNAIELDAKCKKIYKEANRVVADANAEGDTLIKLSLLHLAHKKYQDILDLIAQGGTLDSVFFVSLQRNVERDINLYTIEEES